MSKSLIRPAAAKAALLAAFIAAPAAAHAEPLTVGGVFAHAAIPVQFVMLLLIGLTIAAIVIAVLKGREGPRVAGGSAFLSSLRAGGPLLGAFGAGYGLLNSCLGLANMAQTPSIQVLAHGFAEMAFTLLLGIFCGVVAVIANWSVEARIDRAVLRGA
ncbi:MAG: MotA/TolQ/ExbB proton channel family protein [Caulobacteraceae bacterium]